MQKKIIASLLLISAISYAMEKEKSTEVDMRTPMDSEWFYDKSTHYPKANRMADKRQWELAEKEYRKVFSKEEVGSYDSDMAILNEAAAQFAQGKSICGWAVFDEFGTPDENRWQGTNGVSLLGSILVKTDQIGIGDIFHFLKAVDELKKRSADITLSVKGFLHSALKGAAEAYKFTMKKPDEVNPEDYSATTHLVSLLGHLRMNPCQLAPEKVVLTTSDQAVGKITQAIAPYRAAKKKIAVVFLGENRQATVMGGRKLHRRHLDANAFKKLLLRHPELIIMDCNTKNNRIFFIAGKDEEDTHTTMFSEFEERVVQLPDEDTPFDTIIAMGLVANKMGTDYVGFGADNGPTNVFTRALSIDAQGRTALIVPDIDSGDMRMQGVGRSYKQGLSDCWVYPCDTPADQSEVILGAYEDMSE